MCLAASQSDQFEIDIVYTEVKLMNFEHVGEVKTCISNSTDLSVDDLNTRVRNVLHQDRSVVAADNIEALFIRYAPEMNFLPSGIKENLPDLKALRIDNSELKYIYQENMEQFGSDLLAIQLFNSDLTVLKDNLFKHNPNLRYIDFEESSLKFIDPQLFDSLEQLKDLQEVDMDDCGCID